MAKFSDLSNEVILAVRSHLRKPADVFHLALADRRCYRMITTLLYDTITLHREDCHSFDAQRGDRKIQAKILGILKTQRSPTARSLDICAALGYDLGHYGGEQSGRFRIFTLLRCLTHLTCLRLYVLKGINIRRDVFPVWLLPKALEPANGTLKSLVLCIEDREDDLLPIGSLQKLTALRHLCVQSTVLLSIPEPDTEQPTISEILPANLESLEIHCCADGNELPEDALSWYQRRGQFYSCTLSDFGGRELGVQAKLLRSVIVCWSLLDDCGGRLVDLLDYLDIAGTKSSHLGVDLDLVEEEEESDHYAPNIVSII